VIIHQNESTLEAFVDWNSSALNRHRAPPSTSANVSIRVIMESKETNPGGRVKGTVTCKTDDTYECLVLRAWEELGVDPLRCESFVDSITPREMYFCFST
jgi:hypothetical protein